MYINILKFLKIAILLEYPHRSLHIFVDYYVFKIDLSLFITSLLSIR